MLAYPTLRALALASVVVMSGIMVSSLAHADCDADPYCNPILKLPDTNAENPRIYGKIGDIGAQNPGDDQSPDLVIAPRGPHLAPRGLNVGSGTGGANPGGSGGSSASAAGGGATGGKYHLLNSFHVAPRK